MGMEMMADPDIARREELEAENLKLRELLRPLRSVLEGQSFPLDMEPWRARLLAQIDQVLRSD